MSYAWYNRFMSDRTTRKAGEQEVSGSGILIKQLNHSLQDSIKLNQAERARADEMATKVSNLSIKIGSLEAALKHSQEQRADMHAEVTRLRTAVEQLVVENRNKDRSITELVALNRKLLRAMGDDNPAAEAAHPEGEAA